MPNSVRCPWWTAGLLLMVVGCSVRDAAIPQDWAQAGDELVAQQRYAEAVDAYQRAHDADPDDEALREKLGRAYLLSGDAVRAVDLLPDDTDVQLQAATQELQQWRFDDALRRTAAVLRKEPDNVLALIRHANATAHLWDSGGALYFLASEVGEPERLQAALRDLRATAPRQQDVLAEVEFRRALELAPEVPEAQVALANFLWATGRLDEAEPLLRQFANQQPGHAAANHALGSFYLSRNRDAEAIPYLSNAASAPGELGRGARFALVDHYLDTGRESDARELLATMGDDDAAGEASVRVAGIYARAGSPADAVRRLDEVLSKVPGHARALLLKAEVLFSMGNPDPQYANAAITADPLSSDAHALLGSVLLSSADYQGALAAYSDAVRYGPDSLAALLRLAEVQLELGMVTEAAVQAQEAVRRTPDSKEAATVLAKVCLRQEDYVGAEGVLLPLLTLFPEDSGLQTLAGTLYAARGNPAAAREAFLGVLQRAPESVDALTGLVSVELDTGPTPDTRLRVEEALARRSRDPRLLLLAGQLYLADGDTPRAESTLRKAFALDPSNGSVGRSLADLLERAQRPDEAAGVLEALVELRPWDGNALASLARVLEGAGRPSEARSIYEQILQYDPDAREAVYKLGALYLLDESTWGEAQDLALTAKIRWPDDAGVNDLLGRTYTLRGLVRQGVPLLEAAVEADPDNAAYRYHLGAAYEREGSVSEALTEYGRALELAPSHPESEHARAFVARRR